MLLLGPVSSSTLCTQLPLLIPASPPSFIPFWERRAAFHMAVSLSASATSFPLSLHAYPSKKVDRSRNFHLRLPCYTQSPLRRNEIFLRLSFSGSFQTFLARSSFAISQPTFGRISRGARAFAMEVAKEAFFPNDGASKALDVSLFEDSNLRIAFPPLPKNRADDTSLHNPLLRLERMGCGWLGVVLEWEGVIVEDDAEIERKAWTGLAEEEGKRPPPAFVLKRSEGMKSEHAIAEVLCWSRDPKEMKRLARRKEELYQQMQGSIYRIRPGAKEFVLSLMKHKIPIAVVSTRPRKILENAIEAVGMEGFLNVVVAAEDVYRGKPDPEMFMYAAQLLGFIQERCIVVGNSNKSIEAAHDSFMKCIAVVGKHPTYELGAADLVVRRLDELSIVDLKNLSDLESPEFQPPELEPEAEPEPEQEHQRIQTAVQDFW